MRGLLLVSVAALMAAPASAQTAGDSVRVRIQPSKTWNYGRFVSVDSQRVTLSATDMNREYALQTVTRLEVRRPKKQFAIVAGATVGSALGAALANAVRPDDREPLFGSNGANVAVAAGVGFLVALISVKASPWHWERVKLKPAP